MKNTKNELIEAINILSKLANQGCPTLPTELCRFIASEFNLAYVLLAEELNNNEFKIIGKSKDIDDLPSYQNLSIENFENIEETRKFESEFIIECTTSSLSENDNQSFLININNSIKFLLVLKHRYIPSKNEGNGLFEIPQFASYQLNLWQNRPKNENITNSPNFSEFILKSTKGLMKEVKTINGLLTLMNEENLANGIKQYTQEIKSTKNYILESLYDLEEILKINTSSKAQNESVFIITDLIETIRNNILSTCNNLEIENLSKNNIEILYDKESLSEIYKNSLETICGISKTRKININYYITTDHKLRTSLSTASIGLDSKGLSEILEPFSNTITSRNISGIKLNLLQNQIEKKEGKLRINDNGSEFSINFSLPVSSSFKNNFLNSKISTDENKDKILVIESDNESSTLLNNYLSRWNYKTDIVSSGNLALSLLRENKYVAVILNVEQENGNSLELLQKIKNNKSTRNVPVIVFTVEPEKEKIFLMGSVDYLVKPINYNKLVEILTSYKLRRNSNVLCVDDDQPTLNLVKQAVQTAGFNVIADYRPELVLDLISDKDLDLAIIDLDMPKLNGFDLIKAIKSQEKFSKLPIIIYTGKEDYQVDLQKIDGLFVDLLDKRSTSFNELEKTISAMIKSYEEPKVSNNESEKNSGPKILMAEDYKHSQIIVTRLLKKSGFENIIVVENGEEALNICEQDSIDLILMDMQMPVMNGFEATGKIRDLESYADTPIIALTAFAMKGDREKCIEAGATDYIPKPIDSKEFIEKVKYYTQVVAQPKV